MGVCFVFTATPKRNTPGTVSFEVAAGSIIRNTQDTKLFTPNYKKTWGTHTAWSAPSALETVRADHATALVSERHRRPFAWKWRRRRPAGLRLR